MGAVYEMDHRSVEPTVSRKFNYTVSGGSCINVSKSGKEAAGYSAMFNRTNCSIANLPDSDHWNKDVQQRPYILLFKTSRHS